MEKNVNNYFLNYLYKMETGRMMLLHSLIIGVILYIFMIYVLGQKPIVAENRSILIASVILIYMILFGHGLPISINKNLY
jgi:TRAP-type C4-dicarboxylate transport system permease small subunit